MINKPIIMYESDEAASKKTVTGWVSSSGRFWGDDEHMARYDGSTHALCKCGNVRSNGYTVCNTCRDKVYLEIYLAKPDKEWDETVPVFSDKVSEYFFSKEEVIEDAEEHDIDPADMLLVICEEEYAHPINCNDFYEGLLPEDQTLEDVDFKLAELFYAINEYVERNKPVLSWKPGKFRTMITGVEID